jgi:hypothetical protein
MSAPVLEQARGVLEYAPKWAQRGEAGARAIATEIWAAPPAGARTAPAEGPAAVNGQPPPWKRKRRPGDFEGDIAIVELRASLALAPDEIPEPPLRQPRGSVLGIVGRFVMVAALAVAGASGFVWLSEQPIALSEPQPMLADADRPALDPPDADRAALDRPALDRPASVALAETAVDLKADRTPPPGGLAPYSVADYARDLADGAHVMPAGPVRGGSPQATQTRVAEPLSPVPVPVPVSAREPMPLGPPPSGVAQPEPGEIAALLARSRSYLAAGDVAAARLVLRRAVDGGDSQAALALGSTYDPIALKQRGVISFAGDPAQAREWYRRAVELGSTDASQRIEQLAQIDR